MAGTPISPGDLLKIRVFSQAVSQVFINDFDFAVRTATPTISDVELVADLDSNLSGFYKAVLPPQATYVGVSLWNRTPVPKIASVFAGGGRGPGTAATDIAPSQAAAVLSRYSRLSGPGGRGRIFFGPLPKGAVDIHGNIAAAAKTAFGDLLNFMASDYTFNGELGAVLVMYPFIYRAGATPLPRTVIRAVCQSSIGTQKRRGDYGQQNREM